MSTYDDKSLARIPPKLDTGEKEHVLITQDECIFHVNESRRRAWLLEHEQSIKKKGNGCSIHVSYFICETIGFLTLSTAQIEEQMKLPPQSHLHSFTARHIIYPGKNHDAWWDLKQLVENVKDAIDVFEYTNPGMVAVFLFDCSSAHEGLAPNALNINSMNIGPGGKQKPLCDTIITLSNPPPKPGCLDTRGLPQSLVYPSSHPNEKLAGKPKGMRVVLEERVSVWDEYIERLKGRRVVGECQSCQKLELKKDAQRRIAAAEAMGQEETFVNHDLAEAEGEPDEVESEADNWCYIFKVLSLQEDFATEKLMLQQLIESRGHVCLFLPKFHCELNPSEMVWGYAKYRKSAIYIIDTAIDESLGFRNASDGKFPTAKNLVPQCLNLCNTSTIR
jgi:hypothetical protein